jgi:hypothetical protein
MPDSAGPEALFVRLYFDGHIMARLAVDLRGRDAAFSRCSPDRRVVY